MPRMPATPGARERTMAEDTSVSRRDFLKTATASGVVAATALRSVVPAAAMPRTAITRRVIGANDRIRVGMVGVKGMGGGHLRNLVGEEMKDDNVAVVAVCDLWDTARQRAQTTAQLSDA